MRPLETRLKPARRPLLPSQAFWIYLVSPLVAAPVLVTDVFSADWSVVAPRVLALFVPFYVTPALFHVLYATLVPRLIERFASYSKIVHVALWFVVTTVLSQLLWGPLHSYCPQVGSPTQYTIVTLIFCAAFLFPGLGIQAYRNRAEEMTERMQREREATLTAQLQALTARAQPHFLFNSLNTVASLIHDDPVLAERSIERLAALLRYTLDAGRHHTVPLAQEIAIMKDYVALQQIRFGERVAFRMTFDESLADFPVPPLLLQPLVENAIVHGIAKKKHGRVTVVVRRAAGEVIIEVDDDGVGPNDAPSAGTGRGLLELKERLRIVFGEVAELHTGPSALGGFSVRLALPANS